LPVFPKNDQEWNTYPGYYVLIHKQLKVHNIQTAWQHRAKGSVIFVVILLEKSGLAVDPVVVEVLHILKIAVQNYSLDFHYLLVYTHDQDVVESELTDPICVDNLAHNLSGSFHIDIRVVDFKLRGALLDNLTLIKLQVDYGLDVWDLVVTNRIDDQLMVVLHKVTECLSDAQLERLLNHLKCGV
jgi:hypothetical protein